MPDEFHDLQPQLLSLTFRRPLAVRGSPPLSKVAVPPHYPTSRVFSASDMNLYYDVRHAQWYKLATWFGVVGVPRLFDEVDMRLSYVVWQEGVNPFVVVELLSPGTEKEDLGENDREKLPPESEELVGNGQAIQPQTENKPPHGHFAQRGKPPHASGLENGKFTSRFYAFLTMWFLVVIPIGYELLDWWGRITKS